MPDRIKLWFRFVPRQGWLPHETEGLWATPTAPGAARVDNAPFLQDGVAEGDVMSFRTDPDGRHWATGRITASGNCTIRVLPVPTGPLGRDPHAVHSHLARFGLGGEVFSAEFPLVAFTVPADGDFAGLKALLDQRRSEGWWHYEVGCGSDAWWNA
ncbi:DUF4265 domain-containing protein [Streptomyces niveiscabiei]|uniref:DUF4265 domain-containing protein n=1 Tax=Streptomyces niveiscabiei TaxID=164115 RepID=UPI0029AF230B|nr:DUF4265 domain-containing protein [Streptomyces niveiscabiei]MDX3380677.1 DUF4265 domain-containing protein [Streptomyces niveiscabiei]